MKIKYKSNVWYYNFNTGGTENAINFHNTIPRDKFQANMQRACSW